MESNLATLINVNLAKLVMEFNGDLLSILEHTEEIAQITIRRDMQDMVNGADLAFSAMGFSEGKDIVSLLRHVAENGMKLPEDHGASPDFLKKLSDFYKQYADPIIGVESPASGEKDIGLLLQQAKAVTKASLPDKSVLLDAGFQFSEANPTILAENLEYVLRSPNRTQNLMNSSLINLIINFEGLIASVLRLAYQLAPDSLPSKEKSLSLADLKELGSIEAAISYIIENEVDSFLRGSLEDWQKFFLDKFGFDLKTSGADWARVIEIYQRRNIIVHQGGKVSQQYLVKVPKDQRKNVKLGQALPVGMAYLNEAVSQFLVLGLGLLNAAWKRLLRKHPTERIEIMSRVATKAVLSGRWHHAQLILTELLKDPDFGSAARMIGEVNLWLARKRLSGKETILSEIAKFDHRTTAPIYSAAVYALEENIEGFLRVYPRTELTPAELMTWPVFEEFRQDPRFQTLYAPADA